MEIITTSHIDAWHAAGPHFPQATSADGRFAWHHGAAGYVRVNRELCGLPEVEGNGWTSVYLQYAESDLPGQPELIREAREFWCAIDRLRAARELAAEEARKTEEMQPSAELTPYERALIQRYRTADAAWDAEDEEAWAVLSRLGY